LKKRFYIFVLQVRIDLGLCRDPFIVHYLKDLFHILPPKHVFPAIFTASAGPPQRIAVFQLPAQNPKNVVELATIA
jgi:hypothetical protein